MNYRLPKRAAAPAGIRDIIKVVGELDDRWLLQRAGLRPGLYRGREESPDTTLRQQRNALSASLKRMGNAPGNARGAAAQMLCAAGSRRVPQKINRRES